MGRVPKLDPYSPNWRPAPPPADYSDEIDEKALKKIQEQADEKRCNDEWETVDGPAW